MFSKLIFYILLNNYQREPFMKLLFCFFFEIVFEGSRSTRTSSSVGDRRSPFKDFSFGLFINNYFLFVMRNEQDIQFSVLLKMFSKLIFYILLNNYQREPFMKLLFCFFFEIVFEGSRSTRTSSSVGDRRSPFKDFSFGLFINNYFLFVMRNEQDIQFSVLLKMFSKLIFYILLNNYQREPFMKLLFCFFFEIVFEGSRSTRTSSSVGDRRSPFKDFSFGLFINNYFLFVMRNEQDIQFSVLLKMFSKLIFYILLNSYLR